MRKKLLLVATLTAGLSILGATSAQAAVTDIGGATLTNTQDTAAAALANTSAAAADPNTTCKVNAVGANAVQRTNALVGEVYAQDVVAGVGECLSLSSGTYSGTVTIRAQYYTAASVTTGYWTTFCSASASGSSLAGVLGPLTPTKLCSVSFPSAALNKYHRAVATLTNSRGQTFTDISPVWWVGP